MKARTTNGNEEMQKQTIYLNSESILKFLLGTDDYIDTLIVARGSEVNLATTDFELYEALGSLKKYDDFKINRLVKFFEVVDVESCREKFGKEKSILRHERVEELRKSALKNIKNMGEIKK